MVQVKGIHYKCTIIGRLYGLDYLDPSILDTVQNGGTSAGFAP